MSSHALMTSHPAGSRAGSIIVPIASCTGDLEDELYTLKGTGSAVGERFGGTRAPGDIATDLAACYAGSPGKIAVEAPGIAGGPAQWKIIVCRG